MLVARGPDRQVLVRWGHVAMLEPMRASVSRIVEHHPAHGVIRVSNADETYGKPVGAREVMFKST